MGRLNYDHAPALGVPTAAATNVGNQAASTEFVQNVVPPGVVFPYAGPIPPTGWLLADGSAVSRTTYARLFAAIGTTYGVGDGTTTFNLPDLRGEFLRGLDNARGVDAGRALGTAQVGTVVTYDNTFADTVPASFRSGSSGRDNHPEDMGADTDSDVGSKYPALARSVSGSSYGQAGYGLSAQNTGVARPRNVAMNFIIKAQ